MFSAFKRENTVYGIYLNDLSQVGIPSYFKKKKQFCRENITIKFGSFTTSEVKSVTWKYLS